MKQKSRVMNKSLIINTARSWEVKGLRCAVLIMQSYPKPGSLSYFQCPEIPTQPDSKLLKLLFKMGFFVSKHMHFVQRDCCILVYSEEEIMFKVKYTHPARGILDFCKQKFCRPLLFSQWTVPCRSSQIYLPM